MHTNLDQLATNRLKIPIYVGYINVENQLYGAVQIIIIMSHVTKPRVVSV